MCGMTTGNLSNMVTRGKVVYSGDYIDDSIDPNKSFLCMRKELAVNPKKKKEVESKTERPAPVVKPSVIHNNKVPKVATVNVGGAIYDLNAKKIQTQIDKMNMEMEKLRLNNSKFMGEVIPSGLIKPMILQHNQSILTESKNTIDNIIMIIAKKKDLSSAEVAEIKSKYLFEVNEMIKKSTQLTVKSINNVINEFSEKRNVGERV